MSKGKIITSFASSTISVLFGTFLESLGYEVVAAKTGSDVLNYALEEKPKFLVSGTNVPVVDGYNLSRIIKNASEFAGIKVILCCIDDDSVRRYWAQISQCDAFYHIDQADLSGLGKIINDLEADFEENAGVVEKPGKAKQEVVSEDNLLELSVRAYDREFFNLNIIKYAFEQTSDFDLKSLFTELGRCVSSVFNYDALGIVLNTSPLQEFYSFAKGLPESEKKDFIGICRDDFENKALLVKRFDWKKSNIVKKTKKSEEVSSIKSSESFPAAPSEEISFTMTVGSCNPDAFYSRTTDRLGFILEVYSMVFQQAIRFNYLADAEEKIEKAFGRFVPQSVIDDIISGNKANASTSGEKRNVAVMMTDIRNFTSISEINEPEKVVDFLNAFFTEMGAIIKKHGGIIDKFMGDAIMALFGAPESYEDNAARAARAALEMHEAMESFEITLKMPENHKFAIGTGIHYGPVIVGSLGSADKKEYTVIGDNVNIASRLEGLTKIYGSSIIISEDVKKDLDGTIQARHLDNVKVKGKSVAIPIYSLNPGGHTETEEFDDNYKKGLTQYALGNFTIATEYFEKAKKLNPADKATKVMLERCAEYRINRPENWDGAIMLTTK